MPGFTPTRRRISLCGIVSRRRDRELEDRRDGVTCFCRREHAFGDTVGVIDFDTGVDEDERVKRRDGCVV